MKKEIKRQYFLYLLFAVCSMALNFFVQRFCEYLLYFWNRDFFAQRVCWNIEVATVLKLGTATIIAFIFKYLVDRFLVFNKNKPETVKKEVAEIGLYTLFSVFTTVLFWSVQLLFRVWFQLEYLGLLIGLMLGYTIKFFLDYHFVFLSPQ